MTDNAHFNLCRLSTHTLCIPFIVYCKIKVPSDNVAELGLKCSKVDITFHHNISLHIQVVSVNFDPHYLNESHSFKTSSFLSEIESFRTWSTIFSKEKKDINKVCHNSLFVCA